MADALILPERVRAARARDIAAEAAAATSHYHGSRPAWPGEDADRSRVTVRLADLDAARTWLQVWSSRAGVAWPGEDDTICLEGRHGDRPRMRAGGRTARVWPCDAPDCAVGAGQRD